MAFSSMPFLCVFLPLGFLLYALMPTLRAKNAVLVGISLLFYAYGEPVYVLLMIVCVFGNYLLARAFPGRPEKSKKALLGVGVVLNLGMLAFYKYTGMLLETVNVLTGLSLPAVSIRLPIGISFFIFQALSYVIDVYRGKAEAEKSFFKVLLYISFFPQLIAGPIVKYADIVHQIDDRTQTPRNTALGLRRFIVGLSKKVLISNTMGAAADYVYALPAAELSMAAGWIGAVSYMLQIYFDFSGYSDMAIGLGRMFHQGKFRSPLYRGEYAGFLEKVAHFPDGLVSGISLYPAGREPQGQNQDVDQPSACIFLHGALAWGQLDLRPLGAVSRSVFDAGNDFPQEGKKESVRASLCAACGLFGLCPVPLRQPGTGRQNAGGDVYGGNV